MAGPQSVDELIDTLRSKGLRVTAARRAVLAEIVAAGDGHLTAEDLADRIDRHRSGIHLSTIYRTLEALCDSGVLTEARFADKPVTYHLADDVHHHAVCDSCGATVNLPHDVVEPVRARLLAEYGFVATPRHLTITGLCRDCQDQMGAR